MHLLKDPRKGMQDERINTSQIFYSAASWSVNIFLSFLATFNYWVKLNIQRPQKNLRNALIPVLFILLVRSDESVEFSMFGHHSVSFWLSIQHSHDPRLLPEWIPSEGKKCYHHNFQLEICSGELIDWWAKSFLIVWLALTFSRV